MGTQMPVQYSFILPTYNERQILPLLVGSILQYCMAMSLRIEIIVVDDNSPDGTAQVFEELSNQLRVPEDGSIHLALIRRQGKLGIGTAYLEGLQIAKGDYIFLMDADFSHHPKFIPEFIKRQQTGSYDIVAGSRYIEGGKICGWNLKRLLISRGANYLVQLLFDLGISDVTGSYRLYKKETLEKIMKQIAATGYSIQMEIMVRARDANMRISEIPIEFIERIYGSSKLSFKEIWQFLKSLLKLLF